MYESYRNMSNHSRLLMEKDILEKENHEQKTKILDLQREIDRLQKSSDTSDKADRNQLTPQTDLKNLTSSKDDVGGENVQELKKLNRTLEAKVKEQGVQIEEIEDELQLVEDAKLRLEVNMQAMRSQLERDHQAKLDEMEASLEKERKHRAMVEDARKILEKDIKDLEQQDEMASTVQELKKSKRTLEAEVKELRLQRDGIEDELRVSLDDKLRLEVHFKSMQNSFRRNQATIDEMEAELEEERKQRTISEDARRLLEKDIKDLEQQDDISSKAHELMKIKRSLEAQVEEQRLQIENYQSREDTVKEEKNLLLKQLHEIETKLEDESKQHAIAEDARKKLENDTKVLEQQDEMASKVLELNRIKRTLEAKVEEQRVEMEELEDNLQIVEDAKIRLEVNYQAMKYQFERKEAEEDTTGEQKTFHHKQLRKMEKELEDERKQRALAEDARKKLEKDVKDLKQQVEMANKLKT